MRRRRGGGRLPATRSRPAEDYVADHVARVDEHAGVELGYLVTNSVDRHAPSIAERTRRTRSSNTSRPGRRTSRERGSSTNSRHGLSRRRSDQGKATLAFTERRRQLRHRARLQLGKDDDYPGGERFGNSASEMEDMDAVLAVDRAVRRPTSRARPSCRRAVTAAAAFVEDPDGKPSSSIERRTGRPRYRADSASAEPRPRVRLEPILPVEKVRGWRRARTARRM